MALALGKDKHLRILLADDHSLFRAGMRYLLDELHLQVEVDEADTCQGVLDALHNEHYDLILMDLLMPGMDQVSGIRAAKEIAPDTPIAVVSMLETAADIRRAIAAGAAGFIPKSSTPQVMRHAIALMLSGGVYLPPATLGQSLSPSQERVEGSENLQAVQLTRRQQAVLHELSLGKSNKEIAYALNMAEATVKVHIAAIMKALNVHNRTQVVLAAMQQGLKPEAEQPMEPQA